jgi:homoserine trans-succinylase
MSTAKKDIKTKLVKEKAKVIKSDVAAKQTLFPEKLEIVNGMLNKSKLRSS